MFRKTFKIFSFCALLASGAWAQDLGNSPYSQIGIGDLHFPATASQQAMPGGQVSFAMPFLINHTNPALLSRFSKTKSTIFEAGATAQWKLLSQGDKKQRDFGGGLDYINLAFPISNRLGAALGLSQYSSTNFDITSIVPVQNSDFLADVTYNSKGGLNNLFFALGYDFNKNLRVDSLKNRFSIGLKVNYAFGSTIDQAIVSLRSGDNQATDYQTVFYKRTGYSDFTFEPGFAYAVKLSKEYKMNFGGVWALGANLNAKRFQAINVEQKGQPENKIDADTLDNIKGTVTLPQRITLGASIEREYKWAFGVDASLQDWADYEDFNNSANYGKGYVIGVGGQWIPDFFSVRPGFWRRTMFRGGVQWQKTPLVIRNQEITDLSFRLGAAIPFGRSGGILNTTFLYGIKGTLKESLVRENYFRVHLGVTINDRWFLKPKYD